MILNLQCLGICIKGSIVAVSLVTNYLVAPGDVQAFRNRAAVQNTDDGFRYLLMIMMNTEGVGLSGDQMETALAWREGSVVLL